MEAQGTAVTCDGNVVLLSGSVVGGGSLVNWSASFRTPKHVRREWAEKHNLPLFTSDTYSQALDAVCAQLNVNIDYSHRNEECSGKNDEFLVNDQNELLWRGGDGKCKFFLYLMREFSFFTFKTYLIQ